MRTHSYMFAQNWRFTSTELQRVDRERPKFYYERVARMPKGRSMRTKAVRIGSKRGRYIGLKVEQSIETVDGPRRDYPVEYHLTVNLISGGLDVMLVWEGE